MGVIAGIVVAAFLDGIVVGSGITHYLFARQKI